MQIKYAKANNQTTCSTIHKAVLHIHKNAAKDIDDNFEAMN